MPRKKTPKPEEQSQPAGSQLEGQTIKFVRPMNQQEAEEMGWELDPGCVVIVLSNNVKLFASADEEMNGPGCIYFQTPGSVYEGGQQAALYLLMFSER
jgi:hypothetical protein